MYEINHSDMKHSGTYRCQASNDKQTDTDEVKITISKFSHLRYCYLKNYKIVNFFSTRFLWGVLGSMIYDFHSNYLTISVRYLSRWKFPCPPVFLFLTPAKLCPIFPNSVEKNVQFTSSVLLGIPLYLLEDALSEYDV